MDASSAPPSDSWPPAEFAPRQDHRGAPVLAKKIDAAIGEDRRGRKCPPEPHLPEHRRSDGVEARRRCRRR